MKRAFSAGVLLGPLTLLAPAARAQDAGAPDAATDSATDAATDVTCHRRRRRSGQRQRCRRR